MGVRLFNASLTNNLTIPYVLLLSIAVSMDAFAAGLAYGLKGIRVRIASLAIIGLVTVLCAWAGMGGTHVAAGFIRPDAATTAGAILLVALGGYRLLLDYLTLDGPFQGRARLGSGREVKFAVGSLLIDIIAKPEAADIDQSKHIGAGEAVVLGLALGVDNFVAAVAASLGNQLPAYTPLVMGAVQAAFLAAGLYCPARLTRHGPKLRLPYLSGAVLVLLGFIRLV